MTDVARLVLADWQAGRMRWTDAVAYLDLAGLPALYAAAYRAGVPVVRRFADEARLPDFPRRFDLTPAIWRANSAWREPWYRAFERDRGVHGVGGAGHAQRRAEELDRDVWWLVRRQREVDRNRRLMERMKTEAEAQAEALAELGRNTDELTIRAAIGVLMDWHVGALDPDEAVERILPLGIPRLADAMRLAVGDPPRAVFIFAPAPFPDLLEAYEAARRRLDLDYVVVVEAGHSVHVSIHSGSGAWVSRTYRI